MGKEEIIKMVDGVDTLLASKGIDLFVDLGRRSLVSRTQNDIIVS